jgi:hypothetical protein
MSAQPIPITKQEELAQKKRRAEFRSDALYIAGSLLVTAGVSLVHISWGLVTGGCFCMLLPLLELATGFIRGLKTPRR